MLAAAGFTHIDGADLSPEMRDVAARLGVYKTLYHLDMTADYTPQIADVGGAMTVNMTRLYVWGCLAMARRMWRSCRG